MTVEEEGLKNSKRGWLLVFGVLTLILLLFLWGWIPYFSNKKRIEKIAAETIVPQVVVMQIKPNLKPIELVLPSSAQAWHSTPIWARANGYLIRYLVDIGDAVKQGDLLAEIDTPEADQQLAQAQADLLNALAVRDIAKITNDRWQRLWAKNQESVSKQEVDQYSANFQSAEASVLSNEKNVSRLTYQQQFKYIYAPFDGVITQRSIDIGSLIYGNINGTPQELFQIAQDHFIRFYVDVPQTYFRQIKEGIETEVTISEFPGQVFKGVVTRYAKALDPVARTLLTEVDVENPKRILYSGLFGKIKFLMYPDTINFIIPTTALIIRSGYPHVAVVDENQMIQLKQVEIGRDYGKELEITQGLQTNDQIVIIPSSQIYEGTKVEIIKPAPVNKTDGNKNS
jgi:RND family efflux transporter MFP subunit